VIVLPGQGLRLEQVGMSRFIGERSRTASFHWMKNTQTPNFMAIYSLRIKSQSDNADAMRRYRQLGLQTLVEVN